ncbi:MAG TPA: TonB-dependent receptor, partial [Gemmatimonadales bacterium]|nr:TonB-dependent receptor [Gemmatimonadales bacterium]
MIAAASFYLLLALQSGAATVAGVVRDEATGAPVAGAIVALPDLDRSVTADAAGRYRLDAVPAGPQHIAVRFIGYAPRVLHLLVPATGALEVGLALRAEPLRLGTIEVRPRLALNGFDADAVTPYPDRAASMAAIRNHPLLAVPDALQGLGGGEVTLEPESPSGVHVRGAASDQVGYLLDGIPVLSPYHSAGTFSAWNPDALAGIRLSASGRTDGAPDALAGTFAADTRVPGARHGAQGSLGTT